MAELSQFAQMVLLLFAHAEEEGLPYTARERFERFMGFITQDIPI